MNYKRNCGTLMGLLLAMLLFPGAFAQDQQPGGDTLVKVPDSAAVTVADTLSIKLPSPETAQTMSLVYTLVPVATLVFAGPGLIVGPATGYFYAGMNGRAWRGIGIRVFSMGGIVAAFGICGWDCGPGQSEYDVAQIMALSSAAILVVSIIYDISTVRAAVHKRNDSLNSLTETVEPVYFAESKAIGLKIKYHF